MQLPVGTASGENNLKLLLTLTNSIDQYMEQYVLVHVHVLLYVHAAMYMYMYFCMYMYMQLPSL